MSVWWLVSQSGIVSYKKGREIQFHHSYWSTCFLHNTHTFALLTNSIWFMVDFWKRNFSMRTHVLPLFGWLVRSSVCCLVCWMVGSSVGLLKIWNHSTLKLSTKFLKKPSLSWKKLQKRSKKHTWYYRLSLWHILLPCGLLCAPVGGFNLT